MLKNVKTLEGSKKLGEGWESLKKTYATKTIFIIIFTKETAMIYNLRPKLSSKNCFMKQKCHLHLVTQHKDEHLRHQYLTSALSNKVYDFILAQGAKKLSTIKVSMCRFQ